MSSESNTKRGRWLINTVLGCSISGLALWWILGSIEGKDVAAAFRSADLAWLVLGVFLTVLSYLTRAFRWPYFFKSAPPRFADSWRCLILGFFMNNVLPARLGEFVRAHLGGRATKHSRTMVLATIAAERLADGLAISLLFAALFTLGTRPSEAAEGRALFSVAYGFVAVGLVTALVIAKREFAFRLIEKFSAILPGKFSKYSLSRVKHFIEGLEPLLRFSSFIRLAALSTLIWLIELTVYACVSIAFHQDMSIGGLGLFLAVVNFSSLIPAAPGGIGTIEAMATLALVHIGIPNEIALAMVVSQHLMQWLVVGVPGAYFFLVRMHGKMPQPVAGELGTTEESEEAELKSVQPLR